MRAFMGPSFEVLDTILHRITATRQLRREGLSVPEAILAAGAHHEPIAL